jgi:alpha-beta hydrolase superfamily lysophospholipase
MQHADDLVACLDDIRARTGLPLIVIAHSAGAAILLKALPHMKMPLAGIAFIAPTIATDLSLIRQECDEGRVWDLAKFGTRMRYGVETRPSKSVVDPRLGKMKLSFLIFLMSRTFGIPKRMPVLTYTPVSADEEPYVYSAAGAISSMLANKVEYYLGYIGSPVLLATGENDAVVNDAPMHAIFPWGLPLNVPLTALSFPGADHFSTLFHAVRQLPPWIAKCLEVRK